MTRFSRCLIPALILVLGADGARAQRGGPSEAISNRSGSFVVDVKLPKPDQGNGGKIPLEACSLVESAKKNGYLSFLYIYDPNKNEIKHPIFEGAIFAHGEISTALRMFQCGRIKLDGNLDGLAEFGERAPLFVAFTADGKCAGEVSMGNYKATATPIMRLLGRAARRYSKVTLTKFVTQYRKFLRDYQVHEGRARVLEQKRSRLMQKDPVPERQLKEVDKESLELNEEEEKLLEGERKLLERAKIPPRPPNAERLGARRRGRGG